MDAAAGATPAALRTAHGHRFARGSAFATREVDAAPIGPNDVMLNAVATERRIIRREES